MREQPSPVQLGSKCFCCLDQKMSTEAGHWNKRKATYRRLLGTKDAFSFHIENSGTIKLLDLYKISFLVFSFFVLFFFTSSPKLNDNEKVKQKKKE